MKDLVWKSIERVRERAPLVLNITNYVVMNNSANALLAIGASPIMSLCEEEIEELAALCRAVVLNIGTIERHSLSSMISALKAANVAGVPIILDPVGVGATKFRRSSIKSIMDSGSIAYIRGNASEIISIAGSESSSKGVDSVNSSQESVVYAKALSDSSSSIVCVSGEVDIVVNSSDIAYLYNGSKMLEKVTGMGCTSTAILGAFAAVSQDPFVSAVAATSMMGVCGEIAALKSAGPGSLQTNLIDTLYNLTKEQYLDIAKIELVKR